MTNYREILQLNSIGLSRTSIGANLGYSRNTVADLLKRATEKNMVLLQLNGRVTVALSALVLRTGFTALVSPGE